MLPKKFRLNLKKDFKWVASGKRVETESFKIFLKNGRNENCLVGIALSKSNFAKAYKRNQAKRKTSKVIEIIYPNLPNDLNLVIMPKGQILKVTQVELKKELENVLHFNQNY